MASIRGAIDPSPKPFRGSWEGETKIVIGIDIGTTQSGVAFAFLQQGANQIIHRVTRWPGQEAESQKSKIPTVVWYDSNGKAVSFGAEALSEQAEEDAEDNNWKLAKHFKLLLHPEDMKLKHDLKVEELPTGVSLRQVYSDFLGYLIRQTQVFFEDRILDGKQVWETYKPTMEVVIAHPNGWGVREQALLRSAAVEAKLSSAENASKQVRFVTEAEASVHFCIYHTNLGERLKPGTNFAVCDAGGSTVDTTLYSVISVRPELKLQEKRASACVQAGAIFVDAEAEKYIRNAFKNAELSTEDTEEYTKAGVKDFESFAKRVFRDTAADQSVTITNSRYNNPAIRTRRGRMVLPGPTVKSFFDVCSNEIFTSVDEQLDSYNVPYILLVGGFGDSPFLRQEFKNRYGPKGTQVTLTNDSTSKAVADGAVIWNVISSVSSRAPRFAFGIITSTMFDFRDHEHWGRIKYTSADGISRVAGVWDQIVAKGIALDAEAVCRQSACQLFKSARPDLEHYTSHLFSYSGDDKPEWAMNHRGILESNFQGACMITADMQNLSGALTRHIGIHGKPFWELAFDVCIRFGGTELEAYLEWEEKASGIFAAAY